MKTCIYNTIKAKIIYKMLQDNHRLVQGNVHVKESLNNDILRVDPAAKSCIDYWIFAIAS